MKRERPRFDAGPLNLRILWRGSHIMDSVGRALGGAHRDMYPVWRTRG